MGRYITNTLTYSTANEITSSNYSASVNDRVICTSGGITITLPNQSLDGTPLKAGDTVQVIDAGGNAGASAITVDRNGENIQSVTDNLTIDINNSSVILTYVNSTLGWVIAGT